MIFNNTSTLNEFVETTILADLRNDDNIEGVDSFSKEFTEDLEKLYATYKGLYFCEHPEEMEKYTQCIRMEKTTLLGDTAFAKISSMKSPYEFISGIQELFEENRFNSSQAVWLKMGLKETRGEINNIGTMVAINVCNALDYIDTLKMNTFFQSCHLADDTPVEIVSGPDYLKIFDAYAYIVSSYDGIVDRKTVAPTDLIITLKNPDQETLLNKKYGLVTQEQREKINYLYDITEKGSPVAKAADPISKKIAKSYFHFFPGKNIDSVENIKNGLLDSAAKKAIIDLAKHGVGKDVTMLVYKVYELLPMSAAGREDYTKKTYIDAAKKVWQADISKNDR